MLVLTNGCICLHLWIYLCHTSLGWYQGGWIFRFINHHSLTRNATTLACQRCKQMHLTLLNCYDKTWPSLQKINLYFAKYSCKCLSTWYYFTFFDFRHFISFYEKSENSSVTKGQLISKCPFGIIVWTKFQQNYFWISALNFFIASWGLPGSFLGFLGT